MFPNFVVVSYFIFHFWRGRVLLCLLFLSGRIRRDDARRDARDYAQWHNTQFFRSI